MESKIETNDHLRQIFEIIARAIDKGVGEDMRTYREENSTVTKNALPYVRIDKINTNLNEMFADVSAVNIKVFRRMLWRGILIIDDINKAIYSVCSQGSLRRIKDTADRKTPHYIQTFLHGFNFKEEEAALPGFEDYTETFSPGVYKDDCLSLLESDPSYYDDYRYWVITYASSQYMITSLDALLMDPHFNTVKKIGLIDYLKPDFAELTAPVSEKPVKDGHSLVSVKPSLQGKLSSEPAKKVEIHKREEMEGKQNT